MAAVVKAVLLMGSLLGMILFVMRRFSQPIEWAVPTVLTGIGALMTLSGILNMMPEAALALCAFGLLGGIFCLFQIKGIPWRSFFTLGAAVFAAAVAWGALYFNGLLLTEYDDFSHWGTVVVNILKNDRLPIHSDSIIMFQSYPTGTACFLYFMMCFLPRSEGMLLLCQFLLTATYVLPLFAIAKKHRAAAFGMVALCAAYMLFHPAIPFACLYVDRVLPLAAAAGVTVFHQNRHTLSKALWLALPYLLFLPMIKTSGLLFVLPLIALIIHEALAQKLLKQLSLPVTFASLVPFAMYFVWSKHTRLVFDHPDQTQHAFSLTRFQQVVQEKSLADIQTILKNILGKTFANPMLWLIPAMLALVLVLLWTADRPHFAAFAKAAGCILLFYLIYQAGTALMYLFSMDISEAIPLNGFERYHLSGLIFVLCLTLLFMLEAFHLLKPSIWQKAGVGGMLALCCVLFLVNGMGNASLYQKPDQSQTDRVLAERFINEHSVIPEKTYILCNNDSSYYDYFLFRYLLDTGNIWFDPSHDTFALSHYNHYDGVILLNANDEQWDYAEQVILADPDYHIPVYGSRP